MKKLSFKEYVESKDALLKAIENASHYSSTYNITRYCRISIEKDSRKELINLKPGHKLIIEWHRESEELIPNAMSILFENVKGVEPLKKYKSLNQKAGLIKWLGRNSFEDIFDKMKYME